MSVGRALEGRMEVRFAMMEEMIGLTLAEGMTLVRSEVASEEVRLARAEEKTGSRETEGAGGAVVRAGSTSEPLADG
jgi:hypothetical protein